MRKRSEGNPVTSAVHPRADILTARLNRLLVANNGHSEILRGGVGIFYTFKIAGFQGCPFFTWKQALAERLENSRFSL